MGQKHTKELRSQLRIIVKELLPEIITSEYHAELMKLITSRLDLIDKNTKSMLEEMTNRQKDVLGLLVRQVSSPVDKK